MILIVYRKSDDRICGNSGTGPVIDAAHEINNAVLNFGGGVEDYDVIEVDMVPQHFKIEKGQVVELPQSDLPPPAPDPNEELVAAIESATTLQELKDALLGRTRRGMVVGKSV